MARPFDDTTRRNIAARCAGFARLPDSGPPPALKRAAVAIALVEADEGAAATALLLTRRAAGLRAHRGQWALPGGRCDSGETPVEAALRELHEELGLALGPEAVLGLLDDYPTRSGYLITPVVVWAAAGGRDLAQSAGGRLRASRSRSITSSGLTPSISPRFPRARGG